jgi:FtsZ-binding cell division protein ZapB
MSCGREPASSRNEIAVQDTLEMQEVMESVGLALEVEIEKVKEEANALQERVRSLIEDLQILQQPRLRP